MAINITDQITEVKRAYIKQMVVMVVGLGYVGLPLAEALSHHSKVIGFDMDTKRVQMVNSSNNHGFLATVDPQPMREADFIIIAVPTPVTRTKEPDLSYVISASRTVSQNMKLGCTVILESTVYPGVTEEIVKPILEESGKQCGLKPLLTGYNRHHLLVSLAYIYERRYLRCLN